MMHTNSKPVRNIVAAVVLLGFLTACATTSESEKDTRNRTLTGAAVGIAAGAIIDDGGLGGVAAGAAVGAASGWLYDKHKKKQEDGTK